MSKPFLIGILLILVGLMAATSYAVQKQVKPEHDDAAVSTLSPDDKKKADEETKRKMVEMSRSQKEQETRMRKQMSDEQRKKPKGTSGVVVDEGWYKDRKDGQAGIDEDLKQEAKNSGPGSAPMTVAGPKLSH